VVDQSLSSRLLAKGMSVVSSRAFPVAWTEAGDDPARLAAIAKKRRALDGPRPDAVLQRKWARATTEIEGHPLHLLTPKTGSTGRVMFYCHGGAFVFGPGAVEWISAARVATELRCDLALYEYPKVPEVDTVRTRETTMAAFAAIAERYSPADMVIGGTSAGGGLAVATLLQLHRNGSELPSVAVLFSPWLDMTISHPDAELLAASDRLLRIEQLRRDGELFAGSMDATNPLVSPRFAVPAELANLPPVVVTAGESEILLPEAREFVDKVRAAGGDAHLVVESHGQHVGVVGPNPEALAAMTECIDLARAAWRN